METLLIIILSPIAVIAGMFSLAIIVGVLICIVVLVTEVLSDLLKAGDKKL